MGQEKRMPRVGKAKQARANRGLATPLVQEAQSNGNQQYSWKEDLDPGAQPYVIAHEPHEENLTSRVNLVNRGVNHA
jgi:hypothetical protein